MSKPRTVKAMREYLQLHFRYDTMNRWNRSTSYAANVKIRNFVPRDLLDEAYKALDVRDAFFDVEDLMGQFDERHDYQYQIYFNGRSNGYMVIINGGKSPTSYKTRCDACGKLTWYETEQPCHMDGCDGMLRKLEKSPDQIFTRPGESLGQGDISEWTVEDLKAEVDLVWDFDQTVEACKKAFIEFVRTHKVVEKEIMVPKKILVAEEV